MQTYESSCVCVKFTDNSFADMADISHADLIEGLGNTAAGFTKNLANEAANFACQLYHDYPWFMVTTPVVGAYNKGFFDEMCRRRPSGLPPSPVVPFPGGQCPTLYKIHYRQVYTQPPYDTDVVQFTPNFVGPLRGSRLINSGKTLQIYAQGIPGSPAPGWYTVQDLNLPQNDVHYLGVVRVERQDGLPDNCGDLPSDHPHTVPPSDRLNQSITVNMGDANITVPVTIKNSTNKYNLEIDAGDINLVFDLGGVTFNSNPIYNTVNNVDKTVNNVDKSVNNVATTANTINNYVSGAVSFSSPATSGNHETKSTSGDSAKADQGGEDNLAWVVLELRQVPRNAKTQAGRTAQDVVYAGWFQFSQGSNYFPREPVHFKKNIFKAPQGATSFAYTLYEGFDALVTEYRVKDRM